MRHLGAGHRLKEFAGQVYQAAVACRGVIELVRVGFRIADHLEQRFDRHRRVDHHQIRLRGDLRHGGKIAYRIVIGLVHQRVDDRTRADHDDGVTIRGGEAHQLRTDAAAATAAIIDHHGLPEALA